MVRGYAAISVLRVAQRPQEGDNRQGRFAPAWVAAGSFGKKPKERLGTRETCIASWVVGHHLQTSDGS